MKLTKAIALSLAALVAAGAIAGCGDQKPKHRLTRKRSPSASLPAIRNRSWSSSQRKQKKKGSR